MNPLLLTDFYKVHHTNMYPEGMSLLYSNFTPRKSRMKGVDKVVFFGLQHFIKTYLIELFNKEFFSVPLEKIIAEYKEEIGVDTSHIEALHKLGYLPLKIKALKEGTLCPIGVPCFTVYNTQPGFDWVLGWLTNYNETLISCMLWQPITSATIAHEYKKILVKYCMETTGCTRAEAEEIVKWFGHDFSMRGMSSVESAILSGMGHLTSFTGTDTIPAIYQLKKSYNATGLIGASVPATEHSVMCMGTKEAEIDTFRRLLNLYPTGILSVVSDTWDLWKVVGPGGLCAQLKKEILARDGKLVIRPDSGDPVDIICGIDPNNLQTNEGGRYTISNYKKVTLEEEKGVIELLWDIFGGTMVTGADGKQYKLLDSHIGAIYGDSITLDRATQICERLKAKGFASINIVLGIGSYTYQYNTRDTFGFAMKATYGEVTTKKCDTDTKCSSAGPCFCETVECREIFKDPITDDGTKKSKKGLLQVGYKLGTNEIICNDQQTWEQEGYGLLETVFENGKLVREVTLDEVREHLAKQ